MTELILVGRGLAATCLMHAFHEQGISFKVIGNPGLSHCSRVAAGIWNPVVFKRLTASWQAKTLVDALHAFYGRCEQKLGTQLITARPIYKPFTEEQEKKLWQKKAATELEGLLDPAIYEEVPAELKHFKLTNGYGIVERSGNLDVKKFLDASAEFFREHMVHETFDHARLELFPGKVKYKELEAKHIVFCEGFLVKDNPFFNWIPLKPAKGEILRVQAPELALKNAVFNRNGFLMDVAGGAYTAGATYAWDDLTQQPTPKGLAELKLKVEQMVSCGYSVLSHEAGIRPSSVDRRPIIGRHPQHEQLFVFNGLGTKGVMLAPWFAKKFVNFYLQNEQLPAEVDAGRFYHVYGKEKQA